MTNKTLPILIGNEMVELPALAWDEILRLRMMLDNAGINWERGGPPPRLDPAGNVVLEATMLEQHMAQALNQVKAWADIQPPIPLPWGVRESVEAVLMAYEIRRRK